MKNKDLINEQVESKVLKTIMKSDGLLAEEKKMDNTKIVVNKDDINEILNNNGEKALNYNFLSPEDKKIVDNIVSNMGQLNTNSIISYASDIQGNLASFSNQVLENVRTKNISEVGDVLSSLVANINDFDAGTSLKSNLFTKVFNNTKKQIKKLIANYSKVETNIDRIVATLEKNRIQLLKDVTTFEVMFEENVEFFKQISIYIIAGEEKLKQLREVEVVKLREIASNTGNQMDAQNVNDMESMINSFEKKLYDLRLSRTISIQLAPQIRMLQNNDSELVEKIQSSIINTIPLWKTQLVLALGISNSKAAYQAQKQVTDTTNELLRKNSEILKQGSIDVAKESNRAIVDLETIKQVNSNIILTIEEVLKINEDSKQKRLTATKELEVVEQNLQTRLFELQTKKEK